MKRSVAICASVQMWERADRTKLPSISLSASAIFRCHRNYRYCLVKRNLIVVLYVVTWKYISLSLVVSQ